MGDALSKTPSYTTAPSGGCNQRKTRPRTIANIAAIPLAKVVVL